MVTNILQINGAEKLNLQKKSNQPTPSFHKISQRKLATLIQILHTEHIPVLRKIDVLIT